MQAKPSPWTKGNNRRQNFPFEREVLRNVYGPTKNTESWRTREGHIVHKKQTSRMVRTSLESGLSTEKIRKEEMKEVKEVLVNKSRPKTR